MPSPRTQYIHALRFSSLTSLYDPLIALTGRERHVKETLLTIARLQPGHSVLDVGCGTGTLAVMAARKVPAIALHGLDGDAEILRRAALKAAEAGVGLRLSHAMSDRMPYEGKLFDRVLSSLFFHHLRMDSKRATLREMLRVLKPGGELVIGDLGKPQNALMRVLSLTTQFLDGFETTRGNVQGALPRLMREVGFAEVAVARQIPTFYGTVAIYRGIRP
ncbi:class I SAM-dependent methyltransferase [Chromobacterium vaccinii]|uniref:class I SAM-dependent methyltransferase n=1 Tax=Chromobacterium TaxID=535 RepID=UPI00130546FC|nr:class I SAM-dependent methyltransferase [Chromobacterium sp. ATCC 53434]